MSMQQPIPLLTTPSQNPYLGSLFGTASEREPGVANIKISWHGNKNKPADLHVSANYPKTALLIRNPASPRTCLALHYQPC